MPDISNTALSIPPSPIRKLKPLADEARNKGKEIYHINIGQPDIHTPEAFMEGVKNADVEVLSYSPSQGIDHVVEALKEYYKRHSINLETEELIITTGGSEAGIFALMATLDRGDEVIVPEPFYTNYRGFSKMVGGEIVPLTTRPEENFRLPEAEKIENLITPRTKAIMITNPSNPTGVVYKEDELEMLKDLVLENDLFLIADEVYREFVYGDVKTKSVLQLEGLEDNAIMTDSISKRFSACGARVGAIASRNKKLMKNVLHMAQTRLSPPTFGQLGMANMLRSRDYEQEMKDMIREYEKRRNTIMEGLNDIPGVVFGKPEGAFYIVVKLPVKDSEDFVKWMLTDFEENGETVMMAPASGFYGTEGKGSDEVRLSYVLREKDLSRCCQLIKRGLEEYEKVEEKRINKVKSYS